MEMMKVGFTSYLLAILYRLINFCCPSFSFSIDVTLYGKPEIITNISVKKYLPIYLTDDDECRMFLAAFVLYVCMLCEAVKKYCLKPKC